MKLSLECIYLLLASLCASAGAISDARSRRIPNLLTGTSIAFGLLLHLETGGWRQMGMAAVAGLAGGAVFFIFFVVGAMGAGDVKLMAAISVIAGFGHLGGIVYGDCLHRRRVRFGSGNRARTSESDAGKCRIADPASCQLQALCPIPT